MKSLKRFFCLCFALILALSMNNVVSAAELAGDELVYCNVTVFLSNPGGDYPGEKIAITFKDITGTAEKTIEVSEGNWKNKQGLKVSLPAPTTYNVIIKDIEKGFDIVEEKGKSSIASFAATEGEKEFHWSIVGSQKNGEDSIEPSKEGATAPTEKGPVVVENEEAEKAFSAFLKAVSFVENDPSWYDGIAATLNQYGENSINRKSYSQWYADYVQGGSVEKYFAMTPFEQFVWTETYTKLAAAVNSGWGFDHYFGSKDAFYSSITSLTVNMMNGDNSEVVKDAYLKLMDWQYAYIEENGVPFNFINNRNYIEELMPGEPEDDVKPTEPEEVVPAEPEVEVEEEPAEEVGVWDEVFAILAENAITILVLIGLGVAVFVVYYVRKSKNYDDED